MIVNILFQRQILAQLFPYQDSTLSVSQRVEDLLGRMTLDEKTGQMMQVDLSAVQSNPSIVTMYLFGSILSGGSADPIRGNYPQNWADVYDTLQTYALKTRLGIPIIYGVDAVHGHNNVIGATIFPHNIGMGCTRNPELAKEAARITALEVAATGIDWTFGPCIAVPRDERWGRTYEGFGETPELAQLFSGAVVRGFQGDSLSSGTNILACAKHYLGDGGTLGGQDRGDTQFDEASVKNIHLPGYISAVDSGVGSVMASFSSINGVKMHGAKYWLTDVLKGELSFKGFIVSDWAGVDLITGDYKKCVDSSINAGIDMVMLPTRYLDFLTALRALVSEGKVDSLRIDDAVRRILTIKFRMKLFERPFTDRSLLSTVGSPENRAVAKQCVRESIVLLKKKDGIMPVQKSNVRILVAGSNADNLGNQCGGWTISWQGSSGNITTGTTILQGIRNAVTDAQIEYSLSGDFSNTSCDYSIAVIGETSYAEGQGDKADLSISKNEVELIKKMKSYGAPVIVIIVSGRPLIIEKILHFSDVILAAWLPGTEGDGVADILFGDYQPKGLLSHTWPMNMSQIPINDGDDTYYPLFAYGFGITSLSNSQYGSAPQCLSSIITQDGRHFELTFNKPMLKPSSSQNIFIITRGWGILTTSTKLSLKDGDSTTVIVEIDSAWYSRDDVGTISLTSGTLQSFDGGTLQSFPSIRAYNWVRPAVVTVPARIEAEQFTEMLGVQIEPTNDIDGNSQLTGLGNGDWMEYSINVKTEGYYYISLRYSSESSTGQIRFVIQNTIPVAKSLPATGSWQTWSTLKQMVGFYAGEQTLGIRILVGGFHLNWFSIESASSSVEGQGLYPHTAMLYQNYPNPFNPTTVINYDLPKVTMNQTRPSEGYHVSLRVFDLLGREVAVLVNEEKPAGKYSVTWDASKMASGIYFYRLRNGNFIDTKSMVLIR
jgi:beta-glucosidase